MKVKINERFAPDKGGQVPELTHDNADRISIETESGTIFGIREAHNGMLMVSVDGCLVMHPRASNQVRLEMV